MTSVIPAKAGIQHFTSKTVDPRLRGDDVSSVLLDSEQELILLRYDKHFYRYPSISIASPQLPHPLFPSPCMERGRGVSEGDALSPSDGVMG